MWILHLLPTSLILWVINTTLAISVIGLILGFFVGNIPFVKSYKLPIQIVSILLLAGSIFFKGGYDVEMDWRKRVEEMEAKVKESEERAPVITKEIVTKYKDKIVVVKQGVEVIKKEIEVKREIINEGCKLNPTAVEMYNKGVTGPQEESK